MTRVLETIGIFILFSPKICTLKDDISKYPLLLSMLSSSLWSMEVEVASILSIKKGNRNHVVEEPVSIPWTVQLHNANGD